MDVGRTDLRRVLEERLQQADHGRVIRAERCAERAKIHRVVAQVLLQLLREAGDLLGAPVDLVERLQELPFGRHGGLHVALQNACELVVREEVGGVRHGNKDRVASLLDWQGAKAARGGFGQLLHHLRIEIVLREIDVTQAELARERLRDLLIVEKAELDQQPPEAPAATRLRLEGNAQLLNGNQLLRDEHVAKPHALRPECGARDRCCFCASVVHVGGQISRFLVRLQVKMARDGKLDNQKIQSR